MEKLFLVLLCLLLVWWERHRGRAARAVLSLTGEEKTSRLNRLLEPFGFLYREEEALVSTRKYAWQRVFGYCRAFDLSAPSFGMVFDCEPVYFDYGGKTWLIEFWKGQYGICLGAEIGIYHADRILKEEELEEAHFDSAADWELLPLSMEVFHLGRRSFQTRDVHWWLTGFVIGRFCRPEDLVMRAALTFPDGEMAEQFVEGLARAGYGREELEITQNTVALLFWTPRKGRKQVVRNTDAGAELSCGNMPRNLRTETGPDCLRRIHMRCAQGRNRLLCRLFLLVTRPFGDTADRILFLYELLPFAFRRMLRFRRNRTQRPGETTARPGKENAKSIPLRTRSVRPCAVSKLRYARMGIPLRTRSVRPCAAFELWHARMGRRKSNRRRISPSGSKIGSNRSGRRPR